MGKIAFRVVKAGVHVLNEGETQNLAGKQIFGLLNTFFYYTQAIKTRRAPDWTFFRI